MPNVRPEPTKPRRVWIPPTLTCLEARPEVTAYSGDTGPWALRTK